MSEKERRIHDRTPCCETWTEVQLVRKVTQRGFSKDDQKTKVKVDNISASGACIISEKPFELDQMLEFTDQLVHKIGRVVWTCQSKIECKAGIQFETPER